MQIKPTLSSLILVALGFFLTSCGGAIPNPFTAKAPDVFSGEEVTPPTEDEEGAPESDGGTIADPNYGGDGGTVDLRTPGRLVVTPGNYDFQVQSVGSLTHKSFTVTNAGQKPAENIRPEGIAAPYAFRDGAYPGFRGNCGTRLVGGASCQIFLTFHPTALGRFTQTSFKLLWDTNTPNREVIVPLDGMATNITTLRFTNLIDDNTYYDFGTVAFGTAVTKTIHVNYYGTRPASGVTLSGIAPPLSLLSTTCGDQVSADCDVVIRFTSSGATTTQQRLKITYDNTSYAAEDNHDLLGTGSAASTPATLSVSAVNFGRILVNANKDLTVTLSKGGTLPATAISAGAFTNAAYQYKGGSYPGTGGTCSTTITANCFLVLTYSPTTVATHSGTFGLSFFNGQSSTSMSASVTGQAGNPAVLTMNPSTPYNFGSIPKNALLDATFTIANASTNVSATSIVITGLTLPFSHLSGCTGTLLPGTSCALRIRFRPTTTGDFNGAFTVSYFDGTTTRTDLTNTVSGTSTSGALLTASTTTINFGNVFVGNSATATVTLNYYGANAAAFVSLDGLAEPFAQPNGAFPGGGTCGASISANCTFKLSFSPTAAQVFNGTTTLNYTDGEGQTRTVVFNLLGTGVNLNAAVLAFSPATVAFGNVAVNSSVNVTLTLQKTGNASATAISASGVSGTLTFLGGAYPGSGGTCGTTLSAASCTLVLRYRPDAAGILSQTLTLNYFDGFSATSVAVAFSGNGVNTAMLEFAGVGAFGSMPIGNTVRRSFTLSNSGTGAASAVQISLPTAYRVSSSDCGSNLPPAGSCALNVEFATERPGQHDGNLAAAYQSGLGVLNETHALTGRATVPVFVATNGNHSCARNEIGQLKCWGQNNYGQLGLGDSANCGASSGTMGANLPAVALGTGRYAKSVALGYWHTCALLDNDELKCWGQNIYGQLGLGMNVTRRGTSPTEMGDALPAVALGNGVKAIKVSLGYSHSCALLDNGSVKCWGQNAEGQLGLGDTLDRGLHNGDMGDTLAAVSLGSSVADISVNTSHSCALLTNGAVKCWGNNFFGQLGQGDFANRGDDPGEMGAQLPAISLGSGLEVHSISAGGAFSCALLTNGEVKCWGRNEEGILGRPYCQNADGDLGLCSDSNYPLALRGLGILPLHMGDALQTVSLGTGALAASLTTGNSHACVLLQDGSTKCWGQNQYGQLGLGDLLSRGDGADMGDGLPAVNLGTGTVSEVVSGNFGNCALFTNSQVKCWGNNRFGGLGYGDINHRGDEPSEMGAALLPVGF